MVQQQTDEANPELTVVNSKRGITHISNCWQHHLQQADLLLLMSMKKTSMTICCKPLLKWQQGMLFQQGELQGDSYNQVDNDTKKLNS